MKKTDIRRNDPCPCGSGKKYKNCCLMKAQLNNSDLLYRKLSNVHDQFAHSLMLHARDLYGANVLLKAWKDFILDEADEYSEKSLYNQLFYPWMLYHWIPEPDITEAEIEIDDHEYFTIAESYADKYSHRLSEMEKRFIDITLCQPYSFYEIIECQPGKSFTLKDILLGTEVTVQEHSASEHAQKTQILFAQVIQYDNLGMLMGSCSLYIPPSHKIDIINLRAAMQEEYGEISDEDLFEWEEEIRSLYFSIHNRILTPPELRNSDCEPFCLHELFYKIDSPETVFNKLKGLALDVEAAELLSDAEYDKNGKLVKAEFAWLKKGNPKIKSWDNTVLGHISIDGNQLKINVNSKNRAIIIKQKIKLLLANAAKYQITKIQSAEALMEKVSKTSDKKAAEESSDLSNSPEVKEALDEMLKKHWQDWIHKKIPALNNRTPVEAVKDPDGLEMVKALLDYFDLQDQKAPPQERQKKYADQARKQLGL